MTPQDARKLSLGELRQVMLSLGYSTVTKLSRAGMLRVLERRTAEESALLDGEHSRKVVARYANY